VNEPLKKESAFQPPPQEPPAAPPPSEERRTWWSSVVTVMAWLFGVLLPLVTLLIELSSRMCAGEFFDPLPTPVHVALVASVPVASAVGLIATMRRTPRLLRAAIFLNGMAIAVSAVYAAIFLPLVPLALIAIIVIGMGLLPLSPLLSFVISLVLRRRLARAQPPGLRAPSPWLGAGLALGAFFLVEAPVAGTRLALHMAVHGGPETERAALQWLRGLGSEEVLRAACYVAPQRSSLMDFVLSLDGAVSTEQARSTYYRVTGQTFNTLPKPDNLRAGAFFRFDDEDFEQAGEVVGGRVPGLSLASSELKGSVDGDAALAYLEWTMSFATTAEGQSEARTQVVLPPGAVVSRVTLFIDGQEREAAFASTGKARAAYESVVQTRRDPLLVTQRTPDRIQVQCFPVVKGPPMKIKLGLTVPLVPRDEGRAAALLLPTLAERNFHIAEDVRHVVRVESRRPLGTLAPAGSGGVEQRPDGVSEWLTAMSDEELQPPTAVLTVQRKGAPATAWTEDLLEAGAYVVRQQVRQSVAAPPERVILIVEGSQAMKDSLPEIAAALSSIPPGMELSVLASMDGVEELLPLGKVDAGALQRVAEQVRALPAAGGQEAGPALARAWMMNAPSARTVVVWVHGPHPLPLVRSGGESYWWLTSESPSEILDVMVGRGPNQIAVGLAEYVPFRSVPRLGTLEQDLRQVFSSWGQPVLEFHRDRVPVAELGPLDAASKTSSHLARLWARDEVTRMLEGGKPEAREKAMELATRHQLVTEVTGAVVLERKEQYDAAGLRPVDPGTVPSVPEPETWMLLAVACVLLGVAFRLRRAA
jgi:hypothetical protein